MRQRIMVLSVALLLAIALERCNDTSTGIISPKPQWVTLNPPDNQLAGNRVNCITVDGDGKVWLATDHGASYYGSGSWVRYLNELSWPTSHFYIDSLGDTIPILANQVNAITQSPDRSIWFALGGGGVERYAYRAQMPVVWTRYTRDDFGLAYDAVLTIAAQRPLGQIWIGTIDGALHRLYLSVERRPTLRKIIEEGRWRTSSLSDPFCCRNPGS